MESEDLGGDDDQWEDVDEERGDTEGNGGQPKPKRQWTSHLGDVTAPELCKWLGLNIYFSLVKLPNVRWYWGPIIDVVAVKSTMPVCRYEYIGGTLHFL